MSQEEDSTASHSKPAERSAGNEAGDYWMNPTKDEIIAMNRIQRQQIPDFTVGRHGIGQIHFKVPVDLTSINLDEIPGGIIDLQIRSATVYPVAARKPPVGKGLNVPAEISLEHSWPRGGAQERSNQRVNKHVQRLQRIENTEFISYEPQTGVWVFSVEHFTTYGLDYEDETDGEMATDAHDAGEPPAPSLPASRPPAAYASPDIDPDDTFDFRRKRRILPGAFDLGEDLGEDETDVTPQQSFLSDRSADSGSRAVVLLTAEDEDMDHGDALSENEEVATSSPRQHLPAEHQELTPYLDAATQSQEAPAGIMRARMRAIKESAAPMSLEITDGTTGWSCSRGLSARKSATEPH